MKRNILIAIIILIILAGLAYVLYLNSYESTPKIESIILFYGDGCSHCKNVDDFILANKVEDKVKFTSLEVFNNKNNAELLTAKANKCGLPTDKIGVPFLWDGKTCIVGDIDIIKFFQEKLNAK